MLRQIGLLAGYRGQPWKDLSHTRDDASQECQRGTKPERKNAYYFKTSAYHFKTLKKAFEWTDECQNAFEELKAYLASWPLRSPSKPDEELSFYLAVSPTTINLTLIWEEERV